MRRVVYQRSVNGDGVADFTMAVRRPYRYSQTTYLDCTDP